MSNKLLISIYSHEDEFIELLYDSNRGFEGQLMSPQRTINKNGTQSLSFEIPIRIYDRSKNDFVENPRWDYIIHQYKIRVEQNDEINEFVCNGYTESRNESNQVTVNVNCISLAEFELSQVGYSLTFGEETLKIYGEGVDPNDPGEAIPTLATPDINFWERQLINYLNNITDDSEYDDIDYETMTPWGYKIESWYPYEDEEEFLDNRRMNTRQFYEDSRIIGYKNGTNDSIYGSEPIYGDVYEVKNRIIVEEKSSVWNIQQTICEKFQCWPEFRFVYEDGVLVQKLIVLKNDLPETGNFTIQYRKNLKNLTRNVDSSQIITKMYVNDIENSNVDSGLITIQDNEMNLMGESYLLDLDWYLGDYINEDDNLQSKELIKDDITYDFGNMYAFGDDPDVVLDPTQVRVSENTKQTYDWYKKEVGARNRDITKRSLAMTDAQNKVSAKIAEWEFEKANAESCLEAANKVKKEWEKCFKQLDNKQQELVISKDCYVKLNEGKYIVSFNENGISEEQIEEALKSIKKKVNLKKMNKNSLTKDIDYSIYKREQITNSVQAIQLSDSIGAIDVGANYAYFTITLKYSPLDFYSKCIEYWENKKIEAENAIAKIGTPSKEYLTSNDKINDVSILAAITAKDEEFSTELTKLEKEYYILKIALQNAKIEKTKLIGDIEQLFKPFIKEGYWEETDFSVYPSQVKTYPNLINENGQPINRYDIVENKKTINNLDDSEYWQDNKLCFRINNVILDSSKNITLYDIADWSTIEVYKNKPGVSEWGDKQSVANIQYSNGTDFTVAYGYAKSNSTVPASADVKPYCYVNFPYYEEINTTNWQLSNSDELYFRVKARGVENEWIEISDEDSVLESISSGSAHAAFCDLDRVITIDDRNIILSTIKVKLHTGKMDFVNKQKQYSYADYELTYGTDYYTNKTLNEDGAQMAEIHLLYSKTCPLLHEIAIGDIVDLYYEVEYQTDATGSYYYKDAIDAMDDYKKPQVNYTIGIQDISQSYHFKNNANLEPVVGTKVFIWDEEMHFYGAKGIIDVITQDLLSPENNQITVSSYKNKFEDLFQKITAATVAIQNKEYSYDRASDLVSTVNGKTKVLDLMTNALQEADSALSFSKNNDVIWDESGITVTNKEINDNGVLGKLRITSNGLFVANEQNENGDYLWSTAITPDFINADLIRAGHLDTRSISIWNDTQPNFFWNEDGICAYGSDSEGSIDENIYVKYNNNGLIFRNREKSNITGSIENIKINNSNSIFSGSDSIYTTNETKELSVESASALVKDDKYFYCIKARVNYDELLKMQIGAGVKGNYKKIDPVLIEDDDNSYYEINIQGYIIPAYANEKFILQIYLNEEKQIYIDKWILLNVSTINDDDNIEIAQDEFLDNNNWNINDSVGSKSYHANRDINSVSTIKNTITLNRPDCYINSVQLDWNGFKLKSEENQVVLDKSGLSVGLNSGNVKLGDLGSNKYGLVGIDKTNKEVFRLDEDGLMLVSDFNGSNLYGGSINIGGYYESRMKHNANKGYNFQVDELGRLKARSFELYPRSGVAKDGLINTASYNNYRGTFGSYQEWTVGDVAKYNNNYYEVIKDFASNDDAKFTNTEYCTKITTTTFVSNAMSKDSYIINSNKLYRVIVGWSGTSYTFNNALNDKKIELVVYRDYKTLGTYNKYDTFIYKYKDGNGDPIEKAYITLSAINTSDNLTKEVLELETLPTTWANKLKQINLEEYSSSKTYNNGDVVIKQDSDGTYYYEIKESNSWVKLAQAYGDGANVEKDLPVMKTEIEYDNNNKYYGLNFYSNAAFDSIDGYEKTLRIADNGIFLYNNSGKLGEFTSEGISLYSNNNANSSYELSLKGTGINLKSPSGFSTSIGADRFLIKDSNNDYDYMTITRNGMDLTPDNNTTVSIVQDGFIIKHRTKEIFRIKDAESDSSKPLNSQLKMIGGYKNDLTEQFIIDVNDEQIKITLQSEENSSNTTYIYNQPTDKATELSALSDYLDNEIFYVDSNNRSIINRVKTDDYTGCFGLTSTTSWFAFKEKSGTLFSIKFMQNNEYKNLIQVNSMGIAYSTSQNYYIYSETGGKSATSITSIKYDSSTGKFSAHMGDNSWKEIGGGSGGGGQTGPVTSADYLNINDGVSGSAAGSSNSIKLSVNGSLKVSGDLGVINGSISADESVHTGYLTLQGYQGDNTSWTNGVAYVNGIKFTNGPILSGPYLYFA